MLKISGDTLYELLRFAFKQNIIDDEKMKKEIAECFIELRDKNHKLRRSSLVEYSIIPTKLGDY